MFCIQNEMIANCFGHRLVVEVVFFSLYGIISRISLGFGLTRRFWVDFLHYLQILYRPNNHSMYKINNLIEYEHIFCSVLTNVVIKHLSQRCEHGGKQRV